MCAPNRATLAAPSLRGPLQRVTPPVFRPRTQSPAATFVFQNPAIFEASSELGDITGLYMTDDEGTIQVN